MGSTQLRRPEEQGKTEMASSNPVQRFFTQSGQAAVEVQFFLSGPRERVESFLRAYHAGNDPGLLSNLLRDYGDIITSVNVDGQRMPSTREAMDAVCRKLGVEPLNYRF